jgi:hypothetical protein
MGARHVSIRRKIQVFSGLAALSPLLNAAILLPRILYVRSSSLGLGYKNLSSVGGSGSLSGSTLSPGDLLDVFSLGHILFGLGVGCVAMAGALPHRNRTCPRILVIAAGLFGLLSLGVVPDMLGAVPVDVPGIDHYLHDPSRLALGFVLGLPIVIGFGMERLSVGLRFVSPRLLADRFQDRSRSTLIPLLLTLIVIGGVCGEALLGKKPEAAAGVVGERRFGRLYGAPLNTDSYGEMDSIAKAVRAGSAGRFITLDPPSLTARGYLDHQTHDDWPAMANQRAMLLGVEDAQVSTQPVQPLRYWKYMRAVGAKNQKYNASFFSHLNDAAAYVLDIAYVVSARSAPQNEVAAEGMWEVNRTWADGPRVELRHEWERARSTDEALSMVTDRTFDPRKDLVVEHLESSNGSPACTSSQSRMSVVREEAGLLVAQTKSPCATVLLIHNLYDVGWTADVDGESRSLVPADYVLQGLPLGPGRHTVTLVYRDQAVQTGGLVSGATALLLGLGGGIHSRRRKDA